MYNNLSALIGALVIGMAPTPVAAQSFDTSGTAGLTGPYLFRYVNFFNDEYGNLTESCSLTGMITFDGQGHYATSAAQLFDSLALGSCASLGGGTYGVQSNGMAQLDNPLYAATLFGAFSQPVIIASSTEDFYFDLFIAVQAPDLPPTNSSLSGAFTVGTLDFPNADASMARQGYFSLNADGQGNIAAFTLTGSNEYLIPVNTTQSIPASTYLLGNTLGVLTIPIAGSLDDQSQIISGAKAVFISSDGNYLLGGSTTGSDMIFGFRASSGTSSNSSLSGTYFMAGMEDTVTDNLITAFWGSINTNGNGSLIWHERYDYVADYYTIDRTLDTPVNIGASGSYYDGTTYTYITGVNGAALMLIGSGDQFSFIPGIHAPNFTPSSAVWIDPVGITDSANYTPITNAYAPGELVSLYGSFGAPLGVAGVLPIPQTLNGVQVFVNGQPAPVFLTSANQIDVLIPYEVSRYFFATFQVTVNNAPSNKVTVYVDQSSPGIYTLAETGLGPGAILHADYSLVSDSSPATPGETVLLYMTGLGQVDPPVPDGAAPSGLSYSDEFAVTQVSLDDGVSPLASASVSFAGLAPGFAGLYQVNFTLPESGVNNGDVKLVFYTAEGISEMAQIPVSGFTKAAESPRRNALRPRRAQLPAGARSSSHRQRGLPDTR